MSRRLDAESIAASATYAGARLAAGERRRRRRSLQDEQRQLGRESVPERRPKVYVHFQHVFPAHVLEADSPTIAPQNSLYQSMPEPGIYVMPIAWKAFIIEYIVK